MGGWRGDGGGGVGVGDEWGGVGVGDEGWDVRGGVVGDGVGEWVWGWEWEKGKRHWRSFSWYYDYPRGRLGSGGRGVLCL